MKRISSIFYMSVLFFLISCSGDFSSNRMYIDLSGYWKFKLDSAAVDFADSLVLPGTTDTNKKGKLNDGAADPDKLFRMYVHKGKAWYRKNVVIPGSWSGKNICLFMERTKPSQVFVDDRLVGSSKNISSSQKYDLSQFLTPGKHVLTIMVDNGNCIPSRIVSKSHLYAEDTQTNWNGVIGDFYLEATDVCHISRVDVYPDFKNRKAEVRVLVEGSAAVKEGISISCSGETWNTDVRQKIKREKAEMQPGDTLCTLTLDLGRNAVTWSEFDPALYRIRVSLESGENRDGREVSFGLREFKTEGTQFSINGITTFLRGKVDCSVSPFTGHAAMDVDSWRHYFKVAKQYGINHVRFHSWCPPEACFEAADIEGIYLQPELPFWGTIRRGDSTLHPYLLQEGVNINHDFGNHPSFVMFALGNELSGPQETRTKMVEYLRKVDNRHLHAYGSSNGCGYGGVREGEDYYTTCRVGGGFNRPERHARASFAFLDSYDGGSMNHNYPGTFRNFDSAVALCPKKPIISHESGQYQIYPNYEEMKKYTGVFAPRNLAVFRKRLVMAGMGDQAHDFFMASGKWSAELYCAEIEMYLRTKGFGGFQLLDLQDYPGQGTAIIGILDPFMDSKGLITPEEWRKSCSEIVPMFETSSYTHYADSNLQGKILISNYSQKDLSGKLEWVLQRPSGEKLGQGILDVEVEQGKLGTVGNLDVDLSAVKVAEKCKLTLSIKGTPYNNDYPVWVYPAEINTEPADDILVATECSPKVMSVLAKGGKVLLFPSRESLKGLTVGGMFITDYWNYKMFNTRSVLPEEKMSPGTMGLLMNPKHPLFRNFPTEYHSNFQWFPIVKESYPMILDKLPSSYRPIIQVIDNVERNHKLGLVYEFNAAGGKLLVCMSDLEVYKDRPEVRQFKAALLRYMESASFNPSFLLNEKTLKKMFRK